MAIKWTKARKEVTAVGTTITYTGEGTDLIIQSRKRHIPHANGEGTWDCTSYFVVRDGVDLKERWSLRDAKEYAETVNHEV